MILMTDGFPELVNEHEEQLGYDRIQDIFANTVDRSAVEIVNEFEAIVAFWMHGYPQKDDITIMNLVIKNAG